MPAEAAAAPEITLNLQALWGWIAGGGLATMGLGAGGYHVVARTRRNGGAGEAPSDACPINGRLDSIDRLATRMEEYVTEQRALNRELHDFTMHVKMEHQAHDDGLKGLDGRMQEAVTGLTQANTALSMLIQRQGGG